ncbi:flagellar basal body-associated FliL family protein [Jannaschia sp. LMIT008]|uniref:flagellar basal body-associated FliL family protein n=1 Tax=Jannaschia maritima TaxID=3032585 RepID=UPI0028124B43|nr:flagellar basal body-associated FliL family protein [Jannaschia sp. LMIT008]
MADDAPDTAPDDDADGAPKKKGKPVLLIGAVVAALGGGGAFYAGYAGLLAGLIGGGGEHAAVEDATDVEHVRADDAAHGEAAVDAAHAAPTGTAAFLTLPPLSVSIGTGGRDRTLRMQAVLEVDEGRTGDVQTLGPRIQDTLLTYLRAVGTDVIEDPNALLQVRSQMLRRARMIAGDAAVRDLLVTDFVLN